MNKPKAEGILAHALFLLSLNHATYPCEQVYTLLQEVQEALDEDEPHPETFPEKPGKVEYYQEVKVGEESKYLLVDMGQPNPETFPEKTGPVIGPFLVPVAKIESDPKTGSATFTIYGEPFEDGQPSQYPLGAGEFGEA